MKIKDFKKTEKGKRFELEEWRDFYNVEYYENAAEYEAILKENGWTAEDIAEQFELIQSDILKPIDGGEDFIIIY